MNPDPSRKIANLTVGLADRLAALEGRVAATEQRVEAVAEKAGLPPRAPAAEYGAVAYAGDVFPAALPASAGPGFYAADGQRLAGIEPGENLFDAIRLQLDRAGTLRVRLRAGDTYGLTHTGRHNEAAWLGGRTLVVEATPGAERATLVVGPSTRDGRRHTPFKLGRQADAVGHLRLDGVAIVAPGRRPSEGWAPVNFGGTGRLEVIDCELADAHHGLDINRGGPHEGVDLLVERTLFRDLNSPARGLSVGDVDGSPSTGIFAGGYRRVVVRDSVFTRVGYRADGAEKAIGNIYSHGMYLAVPARDPGAERAAQLGDVLIERNVFNDVAAWAVQARGGGIVRGNLAVDCGFGFESPRGEMSGNVVARARRAWHRDGTAPTLPEVEALGVAEPAGWVRYGWHSHGGQGLEVNHMDKGSSPAYLHGPITVAGNVLADTAYPASTRAPLSRERGDAEGAGPPVTLTGNVAIDWPHDGWGSAMNPMDDPGAGLAERADGRGAEMPPAPATLRRGERAGVAAAGVVRAYRERAGVTK